MDSEINDVIDWEVVAQDQARQLELIKQQQAFVIISSQSPFSPTLSPTLLLLHPSNLSCSDIQCLVNYV
jgi:hypothetical protein